MEILQQIASDMRAIQGGRFLMGSLEYPRTQPIHEVQMLDFHLSRFQVTQAQWTAVMESDPFSPVANPSHFRHSQDCPVDSVSWEMAQVFVARLNALSGLVYRLPTESEWEFAARGGVDSKGFAYAGSNDLGEVAWYNGNSGFQTHPVGGKSPNELGLHDMCGNVWEWCEDRVPKEYGFPDHIPTEEEIAKSTDRMLRGGSYINYAVFCKSAYRWEDRPDNVEPYLGFRLAR